MAKNISSNVKKKKETLSERKQKVRDIQLNGDDENVADVPERCRENFKKWRKAQGMSQQDIANILHYENGYSISKWETGVSSIPCDMLSTLADMFGCSIDHILRYGEVVEENAIEKKICNCLNGLCPEQKEHIFKVINLVIEGFKISTTDGSENT